MRLALFLALLISVFDGFAAPRPLTVKRMGLEQGLSQVTARVIAQVVIQAVICVTSPVRSRAMASSGQ